MTSETQYVRMQCVCARLICITGVSDSCFTYIFSCKRSNRPVFNASNAGPWNPKLTLIVNSLCIKIKSQNVASQVFSKHTFKSEGEKKEGFFYHSSTVSLDVID